MSDFQDLVSETTKTFRDRFGSDPVWVVAAPGRVNLIGEHIDYNDGFVMPMAIDRYVVIAGGPFEGAAANLYSVNLDSAASIPIDADSRPPEMHWTNYVRGVIAISAARGMDVPGMNAVVNSNVPTGGGLSSSAALEVATATLLEAATGTTIDPVEKALLSQQAEHEFAGVPCGIMDQFSSVLCKKNHVLLLDCRSQTFEQVPFINEDVSVLITNSGVKHSLADGEYALRRKQCEDAAAALETDSLRDVTLEDLLKRKDGMDEMVFRRGHHVITEISRTVSAAEAMKSGQWDQLGQLMYESHESLSKDFEVSCKELDLLVDLAKKTEGVLGSRMTGGGFGGCTVTLVRTDQLDSVMSAIAAGYSAETGIRPAMFATNPSEGAHAVAMSSAPS
ncbi:galactokinase [Mariniblastus sp.]|nr:galactokinase [Mariniblastus sp.]